MANSDIRLSTLGIVNEVERRMSIRQSATLTDRAFTRVLLDFLNDVIDEVSDAGDWMEMYREVTVTSQSSVSQYAIEASANVKNIYEINWNNQVAPLIPVEIQQIRRLRNASGNVGTPRQFAVIGVSGVNPKIEVYPVPSTAAAFSVACYKKPRLLTTADASAVPAFPARMLIQGVYAKALLEENGGSTSQNYATAFTEYMRMRREALNRFTVDTGTDVYFAPTGGYGR